MSALEDTQRQKTEGQTDLLTKRDWSLLRTHQVYWRSHIRYLKTKLHIKRQNKQPYPNPWSKASGLPHIHTTTIVVQSIQWTPGYTFQ